MNESQKKSIKRQKKAGTYYRNLDIVISYVRGNGRKLAKRHHRTPQRVSQILRDFGWMKPSPIDKLILLFRG